MRSVYNSCSSLCNVRLLCLVWCIFTWSYCCDVDLHRINTVMVVGEECTRIRWGSMWDCWTCLVVWSAVVSRGSVGYDVNSTLAFILFQGSKLRSAWSPGPPWILLRLPQISEGSPPMYWFLYTTSLGSFWRCNWAPWKKQQLYFEPCL